MNTKPNIINIINFIRGVEPRDDKLDLFEPINEQLKQILTYKLPATFLLQYDAMLQKQYINLLKPVIGEQIEVGLWLEIVKPLTKKAEIPWRGRDGFSWDWHSNVGFSVGYTVDERKKLIDIAMADFKEIFGFYPKSVGSWMIDIQTLTYLKEKYNIKASCNCRDQWGTDGYTLWGGYYNGAYYPSKENVFSPAQTKEMQLDLPVFRMLGSDPVDQYDAGLSLDDGAGPSECQPVITLEPVYADGGGSKKWVNWFFENIYSDSCLSFGYTQVGQENSFGWGLMKDGLTYQFEKISEMRNQGKVTVMTLCDTGEWYSKKYSLTPSSAIPVKSNITGNKSSVWYYNRFYRSNFYVLDHIPRIRDIFLFKEDYKERYFENVCKDKDMIYDNLPIIDGNRWSGGNTHAGLYFVNCSKENYIKLDEKPEVQSENDNNIIINANIEDGGKMTICYEEQKIVITVDIEDKWELSLEYNESFKATKTDVLDNVIQYEHNGYQYMVKVCDGEVYMNDNAIKIKPFGNTIILQLN